MARAKKNKLEYCDTCGHRTACIINDGKEVDPYPNRTCGMYMPQEIFAGSNIGNVCGECQHIGAPHWFNNINHRDEIEKYSFACTYGIDDKVHPQAAKYFVRKSNKACIFFKNREDEKMAKQTFWTKCGREFQKSSTATVTGYELVLGIGIHGPNPTKDDLQDEACRACPFVIEVTEGWGENLKHIRWECRCGSRPPNHKTEWVGDLEDKNTIRINSLNHQLLEEILKFCEKHPDLGAGYNADHLADCRRTLSINCSANKRGIAAKKELIEKFFSVVDATPDENEDIYHCKTDDCPFNDREGGCQFEGEDPEDEDVQKDIIVVVETHGCTNEDVLLAHKIITKPDSCDLKPETIDNQEREVKKHHCGNCGYGHWYSAEYTYVSVVSDDGVKNIKRPCEQYTHYCYQFYDGQKKIATDKDFNPDTAPEWCPLEKEQQIKEIENSSCEIIDGSQGSTDQDDKFRKYKPHCPYISSCGETYIDCCAPNARLLNKVKFDSKKVCNDKASDHCYNCFLDCEDYRKYYADPSTWDDWAVPGRRMNFRICNYCCNNSGYTDLPQNCDGAKWCFCQKKREPVERNGSPCEWFNRHPDWQLEQIPGMYKSCGNECKGGSYLTASSDNNAAYTLEIVDTREVKLNNYISDIKGKSQKIVLDYIKIGLTLIRINKDKLYEVKGYQNMIEFAQAELNFSKTLLYNTMAIAQKFGQNTDEKYTKEGYVIDQRYRNFSLSQLTEMMSIADDKLPGITQDMTVKEIREYKQEIKRDEIQRSDPKLKEIDEYFVNKGFIIEKSAFSVSYGKQIKYAGEYHKDGYSIDLQVDHELSEGEFDIIRIFKLGEKEHKLPFRFNLKIESGLDSCITLFEVMVKFLREQKYAENIIMLYDTFIQNCYIPNEGFEMEIDSENEGTKIELVQWNYSFEKDSYTVEITAEFVRGNFEIQIYDEDMTVNHCFQVAFIDEIFPKLIECWSKLITIDELYENSNKIEKSLHGVNLYGIEFILDTKEFVIKTKKAGYEIEIRIDSEMTTSIVTYSKFGDNNSTQSKMNFDELPGFIEELTDIKPTSVVAYEEVSATKVPGPERVAIMVPDEVRADEGEKEIIVQADKDVKAINFILSKMEHYIKLHRENKTVKIADEERDPMAAYYILKDFLIEYYEISAKIK